MITIRPTGRHILVSFPQRRKEDNSISLEATVLAVGPGEWSHGGNHRESPDVAVGDKVLLQNVSEYTRVQVSGMKGRLYLIDSFDVMGVVVRE